MPFDPYAHDLANAARQPKQRATTPPAALPPVPPRVQQMLWRGLLASVAGALDLWERLPAGQRRPPPFTVQHAGQRHFHPRHLHQQTLSGWHRLMGLELRLAAQALEALLQTGEVALYGTLLAEQCARVGQLYSELEQRAGAWVALALVRWELRLLCYRASPAVSPLVYD